MTLAKEYFSEQVGRDIIRQLQNKNIPLQGKILDYGCGPGYFLEELFKYKIRGAGAEFSESTVRATKKKLKDNKYFDGIILLKGHGKELQDDYFDLVFFLETIEHILPEKLNETLSELYRIIKPGGKIVITTPNMENIEKHKVLCPDCGAIFHRVQHTSSWSAKTISSELNAIGFLTHLVTPTVFRKSKSFPFIRDIIWRIEKRTMPHLLYIGEKPI